MSFKSFEKIAQSLISLHKLLLQTEQHEQISLINRMSNAKVCKSTQSFKSNIPKKELDLSLKLLLRLLLYFQTSLSNPIVSYQNHCSYLRAKQ